MIAQIIRLQAEVKELRKIVKALHTVLESKTSEYWSTEVGEAKLFLKGALHE